MAKVSIIIPIYGVEKYIERCARSLFEQTLDDIEYVFVDDCTPDNSVKVLLKVLEEYPKRKDQTKVIHHTSNRGLPGARETGVRVASGEYIAHCDSDDWLDVTMYQKLYENAIAERSDIVVCGYKETDGTDILKEGTHSFRTKEEYISKMLLTEETWAVWDKLCKRELYETIKFPLYSMGEDMFMTFQLVLKAKRISIVDERLYNYFFNSTSITKVQTEEKRYENWKQSVFNAQCVFDFLVKEPIEHEFSSDIEFQKYIQKKIAGNLAYNRRYAKEWIKTFSSTHTSFCRLKKLNSIEKIKYLIVILYSWINSKISRAC